MSDSEIEIISNPPAPARSARRQQPSLAPPVPRDDLFAIELDSSPPRRRPRQLAPEYEPSLFVDQDPSSDSPPSLMDDVESRAARDIEAALREPFSILPQRREERRRRQERRPQQDIIDLTEDPESPVFPVPYPLQLPRNQPPNPNQPRNAGFLDVGTENNRGNQRSQNSQSSQNSQGSSRNPRRQMAGLARTPSLARSDASINGGRGGGAIIIDLTEDLDGPAAHPAAAAAGDRAANEPWAWFQPPRNTLNQAIEQFLNRPGIRQISQQLRQFQARGNDNQRQGGGAADANLGMDPPDIIGGLGGRVHIIHLDYGGVNEIPAHFWEDHQRPERPKPAYVPLPEAKDGFSRQTGEDIVAVCPGCEQELIYDPDAELPGPPPAKKVRTKKDRAEHHFMAVKACGHVFCRMCYEDRRDRARANKVANITTGFQMGGSGKSTVVCAVEGCDSDVGAKTSWVGIFV